MWCLPVDGLGFPCRGAVRTDPNRSPGKRDRRFRFTTEFGDERSGWIERRCRPGTRSKGPRDGRSADGADPIEHDGGGRIQVGTTPWVVRQAERRDRRAVVASCASIAVARSWAQGRRAARSRRRRRRGYERRDDGALRQGRGEYAASGQGQRARRASAGGARESVESYVHDL